MVKVDYKYRLLCDKEFLNYVLNLNPELRKEILRTLMLIKSSSLYHTRYHNLILTEEFQDVQLQALITQRGIDIENIKGAIKAVDSPEFINSEADPISKNVRYGIYLTNSNPYRTCILTSTKFEEFYKKNEHMNGVSTVIIKSGDDALLLLRAFYREFSYQRNLLR